MDKVSKKKGKKRAKMDSKMVKNSCKVDQKLIEGELKPTQSRPKVNQSGPKGPKADPDWT